MKKTFLFIIFALLFGCTTEKTLPQYCVNVTISDGLPVQFFINDCETFNEKEIGGQFQKCFEHPWECADEIRLQLPEETLYTDVTPNDYSLFIKDEDDNVLEHLHFSRDTIVSQASFVLNYSQFGTGLPQFFVAWNLGDPSVIGNQNPPACASKFLVIGDISNSKTDFPLIFTVPFTITTIGDNQVTPTYYLYDAGYSESETIIGATQSSNGTFSDVLNFNPSFIPAHLVVRVSFLGTTTAAKFKVNTTTLDNGFYFKKSNYSLSFILGELGICDQKISFDLVLDATPDEDIARTDGLDIKDTQDETVLITYSNHRNYAGLNYSDVSPDPEFSLRIPALFVQDDFPQTDEVLQLSNSRMIQLNAEITSKWLLQIKQVPMYMHKKILIALTHQYVYINGLAVVKNDAYEILKGNPRYPLKQATCLLTEKEDIQRNVL